MTRSAPTPTCTHHCGACGGHFHSLASFDAHRIGSFSATDPEDGRRCQHPFDANDAADSERFTLLTEGGECRAYKPLSGVSIWTLTAPLQHMRDRFATASDSSR